MNSNSPFRNVEGGLEQTFRRPARRRHLARESPGPAAITVGKVYPGCRAHCPLVTPPGQAFCGLLFNEARPQFEFHRSKVAAQHEALAGSRARGAAPGTILPKRHRRSGEPGPGEFHGAWECRIIGAAESPREIAAPHRHATQKLMGLISRGIPGCLFRGWSASMQLLASAWKVRRGPYRGLGVSQIHCRLV